MPCLTFLQPALLHRGVHPFLYDPALIPSVAHFDSLPPYDLVLWTDGSVPFPSGKCGSGVLANCSLCGTEATLYFSAGSSFSSEACAILQALCWSRQHHFCYLTLALSLPLCPLLHLYFYLNLSGRNSFLLLFYRATIGPRTLVSPGE